MNEAEKYMQRIRSGENLPRIAGVTIDDLPKATAAELTDFFEIQKGNESKKITLQQIADKIGGNAGGSSPSPFDALDKTGNIDVSADFQKIINDNIGKSLFIPDGTYLVNNLTIPSNTRIFSIAGILKQGTAGTLISMNAGTDNVLINGLTMIGTNLIDKPGSETSSKAIFLNGTLSVNLVNITIKGFGTGIEWTETGYNGAQKHSYVCNLTNISIFQCFYGFRSNTRGEFFNLIGCRAGLCHYGAWVGGGNNMMANCQFNHNVNGFFITGENKPNHGHGTLSGCQFNHNTGGKSVWVKDCSIGYILTGCQMFDGEVRIEGNTQGVVFNGCEGGTWSINDNSTAAGVNAIIGSFFYTAPGGNWASRMKNQYNIGPGAHFEPSSVISDNELLDIRYDKKLRGKLNGTINSAGGGFVYYVDLSTVIADSTYIYAIIVRVTNYTSTATVNAEAYFVDSISNKVREIIPYTQVYQSGGSVYLLFKVDKIIPQNTMIGAAIERAGGANTFGMAYTSEAGTPRYAFGTGKLASGQNVSATSGNINVEIGYLVKY